MKQKSKFIRFFPAVFLIILIPSLAYSHKITVFAWVEGNTIYTESRFNSGKEAKKGQVKVIKDDGTLLLTGKTDMHGSFSFTSSNKQNLRIEVDAGSGHRGFWLITKNDYDGLGTETDKNVQDYIKEPVTVNIPESFDTGNHLSEADLKRLKAMIEQVLEEKTSLFRQYIIEEKTKAPGFREVFSGLGYIFGIAGILAYMGNRKKRIDKKETRHD